MESENKMYDYSLKMYGKTCQFKLNVEHPSKKITKILTQHKFDMLNHMSSVTVSEESDGTINVETTYNNLNDYAPCIFHPVQTCESPDYSTIHKDTSEKYVIHNNMGIVLGLYNKGKGERYLSYSIGPKYYEKWPPVIKHLLYYFSNEQYYVEIYENRYVTSGAFHSITVGKSYYDKPYSLKKPSLF